MMVDIGTAPVYFSKFSKTSHNNSASKVSQSGELPLSREFKPLGKSMYLLYQDVKYDKMIGINVKTI